MTIPDPQTFSAPVSSAAGSLIFRRGAFNLNVGPDEAMTDLYRAEFAEPVPEIRAFGNNVEVSYKLKMSDWMKGWWQKDKTSARVWLNAGIPWQLEFKGGISHLCAELAEMKVESFGIIGGASDVEVNLPECDKVVPVRITGGASHVHITHPASIGVKLHVVGGATKVELGAQYLGAVGGELILQTPNYSDSAGRIDVEIKGGITDLQITPRA